MITEAYTEHSLTDAQREQCLEGIDRDTYVTLPITLPTSTIECANAYIDTHCAQIPAAVAAERGFSETNIVERDPVFRELLTYKPALQLSYDIFGPMFHLGQDKWTRKCRAVDGHDPQALIWHSDGPLGFPEVDGRCPLHTLRFGYFMSDALEDDCGTLEVIRGSHHKNIIHAKESIHRRPLTRPRDDDFVTDHVTVKGKAGTIIAFHNAIWHRALPNLTDTPRTIVYFQYCPTMMHPLHRPVPYEGDMSHFTAEERWLLGEPRSPNSWVIGSEEDQARMDRFRRSAESSNRR